MTTVAITGARGFVGRHTVAEFESHGYDVVRLGRGADGLLSRLDGTGDGPLFGDVDVTVHLASQLATGTSVLVSDYLTSNVALTEFVTRASADAGVERLVSASSRLVYPAGLQRAATETDVAPDNPYGLSKWFAEQVVAYHSARTGLDGTSLRLAQLIGPGDGGRGVVPSFIHAAHDGGPLRVHGRGGAQRDVLDVRDAARAIRLAAETPTPEPALNIGSGGRTISDLAHEVAAAFDLPASAVEYTEAAVDDVSIWSLDTSLAAARLGWAPQFSIADTAAASTTPPQMR